MAEHTVVGAYRNEDDALHAINELVNLGYPKNDISILAKDPKRFERIDRDYELTAEQPKAISKSAATGAVTGGVIGGIATLVAEVGILAIPGVGPFLAAGPIAATVSGILAGGAAGGVAGALIGFGVKKEEAQDYEQRLEEGDILVIVETDKHRYDEVYSTLNPENMDDAMRPRSGNAVIDQQQVVPGPYTDALQGNPEYNPSLDDPEHKSQ